MTLVLLVDVVGLVTMRFSLTNVALKVVRIWIQNISSYSSFSLHLGLVPPMFQNFKIHLLSDTRFGSIGSTFCDIGPYTYSQCIDKPGICYLCHCNCFIIVIVGRFCTHLWLWCIIYRLLKWLHGAFTPLANSATNIGKSTTYDRFYSKIVL